MIIYHLLQVQKRLEEIDRDVREYQSKEQQLERQASADYEYEYETVYADEDEIANDDPARHDSEWEYVNERQGDSTEKQGWVDAGYDGQGKRIYKRRRRRLVRKYPNENVDNTKNVQEKGKDEDDTYSVAKSAMSQGSVRSIHSKQSLAKLVEREKEQRSSAYEQQTNSNDEHGETAIQAPTVSVVNESKEARENKKHQPSSLPYQHRNPAV